MIVALPELATALTELGALGTVAVGVTALDAADASPDPYALDAVTLNVYEVLDDSPVTVHVVDDEVQVSPPGVEVTL